MELRIRLAEQKDFNSVLGLLRQLWPDLKDSLTDEITESIILLNGLHKKWSRLLKSLTNEQLKMEFIHPENGLKFNLAENIGNYAWHCNHHLAHIKKGINSNGAYN